MTEKLTLFKTGAPQMFTDEKWIKNVVYLSMEYYSALKRKEVLTHATTWMKLEDIMLSE